MKQMQCRRLLLYQLLLRQSRLSTVAWYLVLLVSFDQSKLLWRVAVAVVVVSFWILLRVGSCSGK